MKDKIRIIKTCECCFQEVDWSEPTDIRLIKDSILKGNIKMCFNWEGKPTTSIDLISETTCYFGIPNDSWQLIKE